MRGNRGILSDFKDQSNRDRSFWIFGGWIAALVVIVTMVTTNTRYVSTLMDRFLTPSPVLKIAHMDLFKELTAKVSKLERQLKTFQTQSQENRISLLRNEPKEETDVTGLQIMKRLPSSSVWCKGETPYSRVCKFRNLCYDPDHHEWFILKTNTSVMDNVPPIRHSPPFLESGSAQGHPYFGFSFEEVDPSIYESVSVRYETELHFMFKRLHPKNIMHNLHDDVLGMFHLLKENAPGHATLPFSLESRLFLLDDYGKTETTRPLEYLSKKPLRFHSYLSELTCFKDAVVGTSKLTTWYQYGFDEHQGPIANKVVNGNHVREVTSWFLNQLNIPGFEEGLDQASPMLPLSKPDNSHYDYPDTDLIVVLAREKTRLILNQKALLKALSNSFGKLVVLVSNEQYSFEAQIKAIRRARVVVAMHGSILAMTMFCRQGTVILEMFPFGVPHSDYTPYKSMAQLPGMAMIYRAWQNTNETHSRAHPEAHPLAGGIQHLSEKEQAEIILTKVVPRHTCCSNPFWLYRIYQDTIVDIPKVIELIQNGLVESRSLLKSIRTKHWPRVALAPPIVKHFTCHNENRPSGHLWMSWSSPWTGYRVVKWHIWVNTDGREFLTHDNSTFMAISDFEPGSKVRFHVRPVGEDRVKGEWGIQGECIV